MGGQIWVSAAGLETRSSEVDTLAQDIANVNTPGFKALLPLDTNMAPQPVYPAGLSVGPAVPPNVLAGGGAAPIASDVDWSEGSLAQTGQPLDLAIVGPGLFMLRDAAGHTEYARGGSFQLDSAGHITDADGRLLLDDNGQPITLPPGSGSPDVHADGTLTVAAAAGGSSPSTVARLGLAFPTAPQGMQQSGFGVWAAGPGAGPVVTAAPDGTSTRIQSGVLEDSNSDLTVLLPRLLAAQQAYAANARGVSVGLQLWQLTNQLRA